jgi:O-antigen ligase
MLVYQRADRRIFFNQAHDQYLQFAAEGGLLLLLPLAWLAIVFARDAAVRLSHDTSSMFWIRLGALAAIVGVVVQSVWETGLRMPANALLLAVVAAVAVARE